MVISAYSGHLHSAHTQPRTGITAASSAVPADSPEASGAEKQDRQAEQGIKPLTPASKAAKAEHELEQAELKQLRELRARDREVRAHEQAHAAVAGVHARGGPSFTYQRGPDGALYAVGGEVSIDTSPVPGDAQATAQKARQIRRAALAPANPSSQDRAVAAQAAALEAQARIELARENAEQVNETKGLANSENEGDYNESTEVKESSRPSTQAAESDANCAVCGGRHSAQSHVATVVERIEKTFHMSDTEKQPGTTIDVPA